MSLLKKGGIDIEITDIELKEELFAVFEKLEPRKKVLIIPPDITRFHSFAGLITKYAYEYYRERVKAILPALGTHAPMTSSEINLMFPGIPLKLFVKHDWRRDLVELGKVPSDYIKEVSEGKVNYDWPAQVNKLLVEGNFDLILSIGQVVPHEVIGMANYNKNIFVGTGGITGINRSHFLGAVYGMERIMGRADTPVRRVCNYASDKFARNLPIVYIMSVVVRKKDKNYVVKGLYIGEDYDTFVAACELSARVNIEFFEKPLREIVVYLNPQEYRSTWLGNKSIYRTRMAIDDGGKLIIIAPGIKTFGEDRVLDGLIRKYGYRKSDEIIDLVNKNQDLRENLSAAAHMIHGSSEGRFEIIYCAGGLTDKEIESVGYKYYDWFKMIKEYNIERFEDGFNRTSDGREFFFISNPAIGLWSTKERFNR